MYRKKCSQQYIFNSPKWKLSKFSISSRMEKHTVVDSYDRLLYNSEKRINY